MKKKYCKVLLILILILVYAGKTNADRTLIKTSGDLYAICCSKNVGEPTDEYSGPKLYTDVVFLDSNGVNQCEILIGGDLYIDYHGESIIESSAGDLVVLSYDTSHLNRWGRDKVFLDNVVGETESFHVDFSPEYGYGYEYKPYSLVQSNEIEPGYVVCGYKAEMSHTYERSSEVFVAKFDSEGELLWEHNYGDSDYNKAYSIISTTDSGYVFCGKAGCPYFYFDILLTKIDNDGEVIWSNTYGYDSISVAFTVIETNDGGYLLGGYTIDSEDGNKHMYVIKTDNHGDTLWIKDYYHFDNSEIKSIIQLDDGGYVLLASALTNSYDFDKIVVTKIDSTGFIEWFRDIENILLVTSAVGAVTYVEEIPNGAETIIEKDDGDFFFTAIDDYNRTILYKLTYDDLEITVVDTFGGGFGGVESIEENIIHKPKKSSLIAKPNPFNSAVTIEINEPLKVVILDVNGRVIARETNLTVGMNSFIWTPDPTIESGIFFLRATDSDNNYSMKKITYIK